MIYVLGGAFAVIGTLVGIVGAILYAWRKDVRALQEEGKFRQTAETTVKALEGENRELHQYLKHAKEALRQEVALALARDELVAREGTPEEVVTALRNRLAEPLEPENFETRTPAASTKLPTIPPLPEGQAFEIQPKHTDIVDTLRIRLRQPLDEPEPSPEETGSTVSATRGATTPARGKPAV